MKKLALVLILIVCATSAQAQWRLNNIGMYQDLNDVNSYCDPLAGGGAFHVYIVGTNMTTTLCKGVEFNLTWEGDHIVSDFVFPEGIDFGGHLDGDHTIAYVAPEPVLGGQFVFAEFNLGIFDPSAPTLAFLGPIYYFSNEPFPSFLDGEDPTLETIVTMHNSIGDVYQPDVNLPVFILNGDCEGVPNEDVSFGGVKALFQ